MKNFLLALLFAASANASYIYLPPTGGGGGGTITSINGETGASQSFATGEAGTNFNIVSAGDTHTFNLPIASAVNTGKLSNTDWSAFDAKLSPSDTATFLRLDGTNSPTATISWNGQNLTNVQEGQFTNFVQSGSSTLSASVYGSNAHPGTSAYSPITAVVEGASIAPDLGVVAYSPAFTPAMRVARINGTQASPTSATNGQGLAQYIADTYDGTEIRPSGVLRFFANEDHGPGTLGTTAQLRVMQNGTTSFVETQFRSGGEIVMGIGALGPADLIQNGDGFGEIGAYGSSTFPDCGSASGGCHRFQNAYFTGGVAASESRWGTNQELTLATSGNIFPTTDDTLTVGSATNRFAQGWYNEVTATTSVRSPIHTGSTTSEGTLELRSTTDATEGAVTIKDGSLVVMGSGTDDFLTYWSGFFSGLQRLNIVSTGGETNGFNLYSVGNPGNNINVVASRGTFNAPEYLDDSDLILNFSAATNDGAFPDGASVGSFSMRATEDHSAVARGTNWSFRTVPAGSTSEVTSLSLTGNEAQVVNLHATGDVSIETAGKGLKIAEGANAKSGVATLVAGTVTVSTTAVAANSRIQLTCQDPNGGTPGAEYVSARTAATSFDITSTSGTDTCIVAWLIVDPS